MSELPRIAGLTGRMLWKYTRVAKLQIGGYLCAARPIRIALTRLRALRYAFQFAHPVILLRVAARASGQKTRAKLDKSPHG
jgi:hypothetical protein